MSFLEDLQNKVQKFLESETGQKLQKKSVEFGLKIANKIERLPDSNPIKKVVKKMYMGSPNLSSTENLHGLLNIRNQDVQKKSVEQFPRPNIPPQKETLKDKLSPEKWAKRAEEIKRNAKKLMLKGANLSTKLLILQTKIAAKTMKGTGRITKGIGYTIRGAAVVGKAFSRAVSYAGKGLKMGGAAVQNGCMKAAAAASKIRYVGPVIAAVPMLGAALGATAHYAGIGLDKGGMAAEKGCEAANKAGRQVVATGNKIVQAGKKTETVAKRLDAIRKYYIQKALVEVKRKEVKSKIEDSQKQQQIMRLRNPLAYEASQKKAVMKTVTPNMAIMMKKKGNEK